jgi:NRE family putative nickel resistance protein-like MFS transporter
VLSLNIFSAFFTPTYTATIPLVTTKETHSQSIALSSATYQLLGVLGPGLAGSMAVWMGTGTRQVFFLDGITFFVAAITILTFPGQSIVNQDLPAARTIKRTCQDIQTGTFCLFADPLKGQQLSSSLQSRPSSQSKGTP